MTALVLDLIARATEHDPGHAAIVCGDERLSYRELTDRAHRVAQHLIARGVGPERLVCVCVEPSPWAPIAMMAVLEAGGAYVPLDPSYPRARLNDMLDQAGASIVLTTAAAAKQLPEHAGSIIELDREWPAIAAAPRAAETARETPADSLAYVIFTSGSTGRPKGVMVPHRGLANLVLTQIDAFAIDSASVVLQFAPLSFDASVSEVFTALAAGATLCMAPRDELAPGPRLVELAARHRVTVATLPPSSLALLDPAEFPTLRTIISAGEACSAAVVARWAPGRRFVNAYGPTEVTVCATAGICEVDSRGRAPGIGAPLRNTTLALLDPQLRPVANGQLGEIFVGGSGVARGYLGRPDLTAERFVPDPASTTGARMYRTGDLARVRDDGALEFVGRDDHQVKVRGHRIELGEIEAVLRSVANVRDALVIAREHAAGDVRLAGYVIGHADLDRKTLRAAVDQHLPAFARPTDLVVLGEWPRTPAGKIDRDRLPTPVRASSAGTARSDIEFQLTEIWQDVLGISGIGPDDDFFELGGHSLLAIRMLARVRRELEADLPLSLVVERRTIVALAAAIASQAPLPALASPIKLRDGARAARPLYMLPPISGSALVYLPLLRRVTTDRAIWAFHAPGLDGRRTTPDHFPALAAHYVRELLAVQPSGPHLLGGWSMGGALAFEMALQLADLGHEVPTLVFVEASAPTEYFRRSVGTNIGPLDEERMTYLYVNNFGRCFGIDLGLDRARFAGLSRAELAPEALRELRRVPAFPPDMGLEAVRAHMAVFMATGHGFTHWQPARKYGGRIIHFLCDGGHPDLGGESGRIDWTEFAHHPVETIGVPGNHFSVVNEPNVGVLAAALDRVLARLD